ncbi:E3 ubiquitin-protein ligase bre1 [Tilletia horrida]|nr:E3 ubiquitin-protein ligase bre1 [Tilletia horrida]
MAVDEQRKRRHPDHTDDDSDADRKRPYQPSVSSSSKALADLPYDSARHAGRVGLRLGEADKEPLRGTPEHRGAKHEDEDEEDEDPTVAEARLRLDAYRKDAIYRHFLQSKRELSRTQDRLAEREQELLQATERIQAFDIFWDTLTEDVRLLFKDDAALEGVDRTLFLDAIPFTTSTLSKKAFASTIEARTTALHSVLSRVAALAAKSDAPEVDSLRARCHELTREAAFLKTSLATAQGTVDSLSEELSTTREALTRAEIRADRSQSSAVRSAEMSGQERAAEEAARAEREALLADVEKLKAERERQSAMPNGGGGAGSGDGKPTNGSADMEGVEGPGSAGAAAAEAEAKARADMAERLNEAQKISAKRLDELAKLRSQLADAEGQVARMRRDLDYLPDSLVRRSELFKAADREAVRLERQIEHVDAKYLRVRKENEELREKMARFKDEVAKELTAELEKLKSTLTNREADLQRIRTARDELLAQLNERKARDKDKFFSPEETRRLLAAKDVLLGVLGNENRAWRMKDAARRGDQTALDALLKQGIGSGSVAEPPVSVEDQLFARLKVAEALAQDRQRELDARALGSSEAELSARLAQTQKHLDELQSLLVGAADGGAQTAEDVKKRLAEQSEKVAELERKVLAESTRADAACDDLDKLSQAFDEHVKEADDRTKHLATMEDRVIRLNTEKSKADNKYFAAMRSKEALEAERKVAARNAERQTLVIQQMTEVDKMRASHAAALETELSSAGRLRDELEKRIQRVEGQLASTMSDSNNARERADSWERELIPLQKEKRELDQRLFKLEEEKTKLDKELGKLKSERDAAVAAKEKALKRRIADGGGGGGSSNAEAESLRSLLRCSSCKDNFRERIITKCMHTFCAQCIEARIQTRQRKCPHCGIAFAQSEVQMLYCTDAVSLHHLPHFARDASSKKRQPGRVALLDSANMSDQPPLEPPAYADGRAATSNASSQPPTSAEYTSRSTPADASSSSQHMMPPPPPGASAPAAPEMSAHLQQAIQIADDTRRHEASLALQNAMLAPFSTHQTLGASNASDARSSSFGQPAQHAQQPQQARGSAPSPSQRTAIDPHLTTQAILRAAARFQPTGVSQKRTASQAFPGNGIETGPGGRLPVPARPPPRTVSLGAAGMSLPAAYSALYNASISASASNPSPTSAPAPTPASARAADSAISIAAGSPSGQSPAAALDLAWYSTSTSNQSPAPAQLATAPAPAASAPVAHFDDGDPELSFWVETPAGWVTTSAHPFAAPGLPVEDGWSSQARKAIEATPVGYMRFFKIMERRMRPGNPRKNNNKNAAAAPPPTDTANTSASSLNAPNAANQTATGDDGSGSAEAGGPTTTSTQNASAPMEVREIWRCKACGADQDGSFGHTENVQKHIRLRKCKRLEEPPFRSGLLQDSDALVKIVLTSPTVAQNNERAEAAKMAKMTAAEPARLAQETSSRLHPSLVNMLRELLLRIHQPVGFVDSPDFSRLLTALAGKDFGSSLRTGLTEHLKLAEQRADTLVHTGLNVVKQRGYSVFATLAVVPIKSAASSITTPCTHAQVMLWLHYASSMGKTGHMAVGHATVPFGKTSADAGAADAKVYSLLQQALFGLGLPGTGRIPVTVSSPAYARFLKEVSLRDVSCNFVPEPAQTMIRAAELLLAHVGLDVKSPASHFTLSDTPAPETGLVGLNDAPSIRTVMNAELNRQRGLQSLSARVSRPMYLQKAVAFIQSISEALLASTSVPSADKPDRPKQALMDLANLSGAGDAELSNATIHQYIQKIAPTDPSSFTWREWATSLQAVYEAERSPFPFDKTLLGSKMVFTDAELADLQGLAAMLRLVTGAMTMLENSAGSLGNELPVLWSTALSIRAASQNPVAALAGGAAADVLMHDASMLSESKFHLLATLLHPAHRLLRIFRLRPKLAVEALSFLINEFGLATPNPVTQASSSGSSGNLDPSLDFDDVFPDVNPSETEAILTAHADLRPLIQQLDPASRKWLTSAGATASTTMQEYWRNPALPEMLQRAAQRYLWMAPNTASTLVEAMCTEAAYFGNATAAAASKPAGMGGGFGHGSIAGASGSGVVSQGGPGVEQEALDMAMYQLRRSFRKVDLILDDEAPFGSGEEEAAAAVAVAAAAATAQQQQQQQTEQQQQQPQQQQQQQQQQEAGQSEPILAAAAAAAAAAQSVLGGQAEGSAGAPNGEQMQG